MSRRGYDVTVRCTHEGCTEYDRYHFDLRADMERHFDREPQNQHKCIRHRQEHEVLSETNRLRVEEYTNFETDHGKFWGKDRPFSGFASGPGFKAFAKDFPPGTKIRVTTELILPERGTP